jgi:hypothetical protein
MRSDKGDGKFGWTMSKVEADFFTSPFNFAQGPVEMTEL